MVSSALLQGIQEWADPSSSLSQTITNSAAFLAPPLHTAPAITLTPDWGYKWEGGQATIHLDGSGGVPLTVGVSIQNQAQVVYGFAGVLGSMKVIDAQTGTATYLGVFAIDVDGIHNIMVLSLGAAASSKSIEATLSFDSGIGPAKATPDQLNALLSNPTNQGKIIGFVFLMLPFSDPTDEWFSGLDPRLPATTTFLNAWLSGGPEGAIPAFRIPQSGGIVDCLRYPQPFIVVFFQSQLAP